MSKYIKLRNIIQKINFLKYLPAFFLVVLFQACEKIPDSDVQFSFTQIFVPTEVPRTSAMSFELNGEGYVLCGRNNAPLKDFWKFNPSNNTWTRLNDFAGQERVKGIAVNCNGKIYAGLGYNINNGRLAPESYLKDFYVYNAETDSWEKLCDFPDDHTCATIAFATQNNIYVSSGFDRARFSSSTYEYSVENNNWRKVGDISNPRTSATCVNVGRIFGGTGFGYINNLNDWQEFDTITSSWNNRKSMPDNGRLGAFSFAHGNSVFVCAGRHWGGDNYSRKLLNDIYEYDINENIWKKAGYINGAGREGAICFTIQQKTYYGFGENDESILTDFYSVQPN